MRRTKIVGTLGPASCTPEAIAALIRAGLDVARVNFSHGDHRDHASLIRIVREEARKQERAVGILQDLQGPKIRTGRFTDGKVELKEGNEFTITTRDVPGDARVVSTTYKSLPRDVKPGVEILLDDGYLQLEVIEVVGEDIRTRVVIGGTLKNNKGINLPGLSLSTPALTDKDKRDLAFGLTQGVDFIALSFVRNPDDIAEARRLAMIDDHPVPIIAKIEKPEGVERLEEIVNVADGIMVARGDLGVEMGPEKVPLIQKRCIELTNRLGKVVITATQVLESMIENPRPTRAEASDVANAVLDGTDALMLSAESASGKYPVEAVRTMGRIIEEIETSKHYRTHLEPRALDLPHSTNAIARAAVAAAQQMGLKTIACYSESGGVARLMSEYRPEARIFVLTTNETTYQRLALYWGVTPLHVAPAVTTDEMFARIEAKLKRLNVVESGERIVITMGVPVGAGESTNLLKIHTVS